MDIHAQTGLAVGELERGVVQACDGFGETQSQPSLGGDLGEPHHGDFFVRLKSDHTRATDDVMAQMLTLVQERVPGVKIELAQLMEDLIGDLTAVPQPIEVKLYATNPATLIPQARAVAAAIGKIAGVVEIKDGVVLAGDGIDLKVDAVKAAIEGSNPEEVTRGVDAALNGTIATRLPRITKVVDVRVRVPNATSMHDSGLAELPIRAADGHLFPLRRVASLTPASGEPEISRDDLRPMTRCGAR